MHEGHRRRMLDRLVGGGEGLQDHEMLEILLFGVIPRKNTNDVAHRLLDAFGSLKGVFLASREQLKNVEGVGEAASAHLYCMGLCFKRLQKSEESKPVLFNVASFTEYLQKRYSGLREEVLEVFCLDARDRVKQSKQFTSEKQDRAIAVPNEVSTFVLACKPHALVAAHNHPGSSNQPSREDDNFTAQLQIFCSMNNISLYDHFIIGNDGYYSYRFSGRMSVMQEEFAVSKLLEKKGLS